MAPGCQLRNRSTAALLVAVMLAAPMVLHVEADEWCPAQHNASAQEEHLLVRHPLVSPHALCLNGTEAAVYTNGKPGAPCLVIHVQGGGFCSTLDECESFLDNTAPDPLPIYRPSSILSSLVESNALLHCCEHAYVPHCSKDMYTGNITRTNSATGNTMHFRGAIILQEALRAVDAETPLASYQQILFSGTSAGSIGLSVNLNAILDEFDISETAHFLADSGWFTQASPLPQYASQGNVKKRVSDAISLWDSEALVRRHCSLEPITDCYLQEHTSSLIDVPSLYLTSLYDGFYILLQTDSLTSGSDIEKYTDFLFALGGAVRHSVQHATLHWPLSHAGKSLVVSPSCAQHGYIFVADPCRETALRDYARDFIAAPDATLRVWDTAAGELSFSEVLEHWLHGKGIQALLPANATTGSANITGNATLLMDECLAFACNPTCPIDIIEDFPQVRDTTGESGAQTAWIFSAVIIFLTLLAFGIFYSKAVFVFLRFKAKIAAADRSDIAGIPVLDESAQLTVLFENITYWLDKRDIKAPKESEAPAAPDAPRRCLVSDASGVFPAGQLTAILGPSGCGKSTLLDVLSGRRKYGVVSGKTYLNGTPYKKSMLGLVSYVESDTVFYDNLTVQETLMYDILLHSHLALREIDTRRFWGVVQELDLGSALTVPMCNCSTGQRRRVAVALAMLQERPVLYFDEPTSGLDATVALQLVRLLRGIALTGRAVVVTIHQPRNEILSLIDQFVVLKSGKILVSGTLEDVVSGLAVHSVETGNAILDSISAASETECDQLAAIQRERASERVSTLVKSLLERRKMFVSVDRDHKSHQSSSWSVLSVVSLFYFSLGRVGAMLLRSMTHEWKFVLVVAIADLGVKLLIGAIFKDFKISSSVDALVFTAAVMLSLTLTRLIVGQKLSITLESDHPVHLQELRQQVFTAVDYATFIHVRECGFVLFCSLPSFTVLYFWMDIGQGELSSYMYTALLVAMGGIAEASIVSTIFNLGFQRKIALMLIQVFEVTEATFSGVLIPVGYMPGWISWIQYATISFNMARPLLYVNMLGGDDTCSQHKRLDEGAAGCYEQSTAVRLRVAGFQEQGEVISPHIYFLIFYVMGMHAVTVLCINIRNLARLRRI